MYDIGWASRDITPERPAMLQGQMYRRIAESAHDPITVTAWAITASAELPPVESGNTSAGGRDAAVLVSCDLTFPSDGLYAAVRAGLAERVPKVAPEHLVLLATHTHASLVLTEGNYEYPGANVMSPSECESFVAEKILDAIEEAWHGRRPRRIRRAFGHAVVGHNRYAVYDDGTAQMYGKTDRADFAHVGGYEDHSFDLFAVYDVEDEPRSQPARAAGGAAPRPRGPVPAGLALAIPCPSQVDEHLSQFSADYWHEVRVGLREQYGGDLSVLALCAAAGDQSPHFLMYGDLEREMRERRGVSEREEIAHRVAAGVDRALETCSEDLDETLRHHSTTLALTPRGITKEDRTEAARIYEDAVKAGKANGWFPQRAKRVVDIFDGRTPSQPVPVEVHVIRLGDAVLATSPFELFLDYGMRIKARSAAAQTAVIQLSGRRSYLPTERAVAAGSYGAFPVVSDVGPVGGRQLVEETLAMIAASFA